MSFNLNALIGVDKNFVPKDAEAVVDVAIIPDKESECLTFLLSAKSPTIAKEAFPDRFMAALLSVKMLDTEFSKTYRVLTIKEVEIMEFISEAYDIIVKDSEKTLLAYISPPGEQGQRAISFTVSLDTDFKKGNFVPEISKIFTLEE